MLDTETKHRIDDARNILVGKVPDPKSQVEQITIALIYKFMDDMDKESVELGGVKTFFEGEYEKYSFTNVCDIRIGGFEMLNLYSEALLKMNQNPNIPQLFRDIFKNAYLPYRDPETLKMFLKTINEFQYDHSERLGDAYEYLLSIMSSQGDAGQFRTPRHIIDFMVEIMQPQKNETILDPAQGTAGFLISSFKYIIKNSLHLTVEEKSRIMTNLVGYDISPDMVRLALVNMYLHQFPNPQIYEYDTLTSQDKWNDYYDVIFANPPFMSPKGGIKPHKRFSVQSNRSEVLFVDYIAEHLKTNGRAGVIVPEGIIFQSANAYKALRKMLVDKYLYAVVSLPAGLFQPYSGVKTSILLMDKGLAQKTDKILFVKINNDGYGLGAQRRPVETNDLPLAKELIINYRETLLANKQFKHDANGVDYLIIEKSKIANNGDYNLSIDRNRIVLQLTNCNFPIVNINDYCEFKRGTSITKKDVTDGNIPVIAGGQQAAYSHNIANRPANTITISSSGAYAGFVNFHPYPIFASDCFTVEPKNNSEIDIKYLFYLLKSKQPDIYKFQTGGGQPHVYSKDFELFQIPLPPLEVQKEIVNKLEGYQKIIDGAKQIVNNYKPQIDIDPQWKMVELGDIIKINEKTAVPFELYGDSQFTYIDISSVENETGIISTDNILNTKEAPSRARRVVRVNDILLSTVRPNLKAFAYIDKLPVNPIASTGFAVLTSTEKVISRYVYYLLFSPIVLNQMYDRMGKGSYPSINQKDVSELKIPLPSIDVQQQIANQIEKVQAIINANKELIQIFEQKIKDEIAKVWGK